MSSAVFIVPAGLLSFFCWVVWATKKERLRVRREMIQHDKDLRRVELEQLRVAVLQTHTRMDGLERRIGDLLHGLMGALAKDNPDKDLSQVPCDFERLLKDEESVDPGPSPPVEGA